MNRRPEQSMSDVAYALHCIIKDSPGIHFRSLGREAGLTSVGQLRHHLDALRRQGAIVELQDGRFKRFFAAGEHDPRLRDGLTRFARRVPRRIAKLLLSHPMNRTEIRRSLNCADSTLGYHLNRMVELGDLERSRGRNCCVYSLTDPEFVRYILRHYPAPSLNRERRVETPGQNGAIGPNGLHAPENRPLRERASQNRGLGEQAPVWTRQPQSDGGKADAQPPRRDTRPAAPAMNGGDKKASPAAPRPSPRPVPAKPAEASGRPREDKQETVSKRDPRGQQKPSEVPRWLLSG